MDDTFGRQAEALVRDNQHFRVKSDNDDKTIHLMREQYDALAESVEGMRSTFERELHKLRVERDKAVLKHDAMESLLKEASGILVQAFRANEGDETPEKLPGSRGAHVQDDRMPIPRLG